MCSALNVVAAIARSPPGANADAKTGKLEDVHDRLEFEDVLHKGNRDIGFPAGEVVQPCGNGGAAFGRHDLHINPMLRERDGDEVAVSHDVYRGVKIGRVFVDLVAYHCRVQGLFQPKRADTRGVVFQVVIENVLVAFFVSIRNGRPVRAGKPVPPVERGGNVLPLIGNLGELFAVICGEHPHCAGVLFVEYQVAIARNFDGGELDFGASDLDDFSFCHFSFAPFCFLVAVASAKGT